MKETIKEKSWEEFRRTGLFWFVNSVLHIFGWVLVAENENGKVLRVYPARTRYRGFAEEVVSKNIVKITEYLKDNIDELVEEVRD